MPKFEELIGKDFVTATWLIDELEQYKLRNVSKSSLIQSLKEALYDFQAKNL